MSFMMNIYIFADVHN